MTDEVQAPALILVVDDVQEIVEELVALLELLDLPAMGAHSLAEALAILEAVTSIQVVACDVRLNRESGLEIIQRVANNALLADRPLKYVFMTGDPMRPDEPARPELLLVDVPPSASSTSSSLSPPQA